MTRLTPHAIRHGRWPLASGAEAFSGRSSYSDVETGQTNVNVTSGAQFALGSGKKVKACPFVGIGRTSGLQDAFDFARTVVATLADAHPRGPANKGGPASSHGAVAGRVPFRRDPSHDRGEQDQRDGPAD